MIVSMTGFGAAQAVEAGIGYAVEIRSLNNRYYKASIKLPEGLAAMEADVDRWLRASLSRGTITYTLRLRDDSPAAAYHVNVAALRTYLERLRSVQRTEPDATTIDLAALMELPGVCEAPELDEAAWASRRGVIERLTRQAIEELLGMRRREGKALRDHMLEQVQLIRSTLDAVKTRAPGVIEEYQDKLRTRVNRLMQQAQLELDKDALIREVALFADRCDISEELIRLASHADQFVQMCDSGEETGRRLDFLTQELLREANTIGSKSNDGTITRHIVDVKASIERLKEQVQNVE